MGKQQLFPIFLSCGSFTTAVELEKDFLPTSVFPKRNGRGIDSSTSSKKFDLTKTKLKNFVYRNFKLESEFWYKFIIQRCIFRKNIVKYSQISLNIVIVWRHYLAGASKILFFMGTWEILTIIWRETQLCMARFFWNLDSK